MEESPLPVSYRPARSPRVLSLSPSPRQTWNSVGVVRGYNDDQDNAVDVEFHDTAVHHAMHLTNALGHTLADLSQEAVLLACPATDELARYRQTPPPHPDSAILFNFSSSLPRV